MDTMNWNQMEISASISAIAPVCHPPLEESVKQEPIVTSLGEIQVSRDQLTSRFNMVCVSRR